MKVLLEMVFFFAFSVFFFPSFATCKFNSPVFMKYGKAVGS